jgi:hypothetical protein
MFYAFTLAFVRRLPRGAAPSLVHGAQPAVLSFGQYVVVILLLIEVSLVLGALVSRLLHKRLS